MVAERGADLWALTDHDNCAGCADAERAAERHGIEFLPGIEVSAYLERSVHILGYGVDPESTVIEELSERLHEARRERMGEMLDKLDDLGVEIDMGQVESLADGSPLSRSHLSRVLVDEGPASTRDEAFERFISVEAPAYVPVGWPSIPQTIERIHASGGAAVLAHPGRYDIDRHISDWADTGLDGIEVVHPDHSRADRTRYTEMAEELALIPTKGSDFHGRSEESWETFGALTIENSTLQALRRAIESHR